MTFHILPSLLGFGIAALGVSTSWVANTVETLPPQTSNWMEFGGSMGIVAGLSYAVLTLWKELNKQRDKFDELNHEVRGEWKTQSDKLIQVLEKLDPDK